MTEWLSIAAYIFFFFSWAGGRLHWVFVATPGLSLVAVRGFLISVASLAEERGLQSTGSVVAAQGLSCSMQNVGSYQT